MKAMVLQKVGDFCLTDVEAPRPDAHEVLVEVRAAGICGSDISRVYRTGAYSYPLIPGHEFSGVVVGVGEAVDCKWKGRRVGIFPLIPCKTCVPCQRKQYELCKNYSYLGSRRDGGFAEYVTVPEGNLLEIPDSVSFEEAAMLEPMAVAVHAMRRLVLKETDNVVICGLGTIGILLWMFLREAGIKHIFVIGNKEFQRKTLLRQGCQEKFFCDTRKEDVGKWVQRQTDGAGADVFFECVGKNETFMQALENTASGGKICLVGNPDADRYLSQALYWKILRNQLTITGTWNSSFTHSGADDWHYALARLSEKKIKPAELITHRFTLENLERGFHIMRDKTEDYVKIMGIREN